MGINTIHDYSEDYMISKNLTNGTIVRGNVLGNVDLNYMSAITGYDLTKTQLVIRANGWCNVSPNDLIKTPLFENPLKVIQVLNNFDNPLEFKRRKDTSNFTGASDIYLG